MRKKRVIRVLIVALIVMVFCIWQNNHIQINNIEYSNSKIDKEFDGFKIVQVSDLHNKDFGDRLVKKIEGQKPDIIVVTGDLIDGSNTDIDVAMEFLEKAKTIAPIYYVSGNHEEWSGVYEDLKNKMEEIDINILDNKKVQIKKGDSHIDLIGIKDIAFCGNYISELNKLAKEDSDFEILLSHRPELFEFYRDVDVDLVFSGHAHGGQFRIPFVGGVFAPGQGFFPEYIEGIHKDKNTSMVVSRGLGNSVIPIRIFNRPEIVKVTLKAEKN